MAKDGMGSGGPDPRLAAALAAVFGLAVFAAPTGAQTPPQTPEKPPASAPAAAPAPAPSVAEADKVEPEALEALKEMSAYLGTLSAFEVHADTTRDLVTVNGHRVQIGGSSDYKVRRPNGFRIDVSTDLRNRRFYYDGKQFTIYAPTLGYYATAAAPPTILQTLDVLQERYGIDLPLDDLFRWNDPASRQAQDLTSGFEVGPAKIDGVDTDHYAFREKDRDWEIWIQQGAQALPLKVVIVDLSDDARPTYTARLKWNLKPTLTADTFVFRPGPDAKAIRLAALNQ